MICSNCKKEVKLIHGLFLELPKGLCPECGFEYKQKG
jgi:DNA-directed RNA polymerase subunit RPC12/RpoP